MPYSRPEVGVFSAQAREKTWGDELTIRAALLDASADPNAQPAGGGPSTPPPQPE